MRALTAVRVMHTDCARLLGDVDALLDPTAGLQSLRGWLPVHGSVVTGDLSVDRKRGYHMAEGMYRHYVRSTATPNQSPTEVRGLAIIFTNFSKHNKVELQEPLIVGTSLTYELRAPTNKSNTQSVWDGYELYFHLHRTLLDGKRHAITRDELAGSPYAHISAGSLIYRTLYALDSRQALEDFCTSAWL